MWIVKIGGGASINIDGIVEDLAGFDQKMIIVHGANALRDELAQKLNVPRKTLKSVSGYSSVFSDEDALDVMMMAYSGLRNKRIVEKCQQNGINAVGLSGIDGKCIQGNRNRGIRIRDGQKVRIVRDFSGKPAQINQDLLNLLLENGFTPVLTVPIIDENNFAINSENDDIVNLLQNTYQADTIIQLIEAPGFLDDPDDPHSLVSNLSKLDLERREAQVEGRMKRKMLALNKLFQQGATKVYLSDGRVDHPIQKALSGAGTVISG